MNDFLNKEEKQRAKECVYNIKDKMNAIENEVFYKDKSYKEYLLEKLQSILWDTNCLINMCKSKGDD